jgi:hypothetical protein
MLKGVRGTAASVIGLYTALEILCGTHIEAVVGAAKDIHIVHGAAPFDSGWWFF